jgi:REP element-mobilizing transposase RayT
MYKLFLLIDYGFKNMARQLRIEFEGAFYHVTSRGNLRDKIYFQDRDREKFLEILERTRERYSYLLHAYALMDNHYHLLIETPMANISQIMQNINTSHTVYINRKYHRSGHLFQGRFKGIIVDKEEYLVTLSRYIHLNPVRAKRVQRPEEYRWSSYNAYINAKGKSLLVDTEDTLNCFSNRHNTAIKKYKEFVEAEVDEKDNPFNDVEAGILLGTDRFKERIKEYLDNIKSDDEVPQVKRLKEKIPIDRVIKICSNYYGKTHEDLLRRKKGKRERQVAIYLAKALSGGKNVEIGSYFGIKAPAVSVAISTVEKDMRDSLTFKKEIDKITKFINK